MKKKSKKGMALVWMISIGVAILALSIFASVFGLKFISKAMNDIGMQYVVIFLIVVLAIVFRNFTEQLLMTLLSVFKGLFGLIKSIF